jgi:hypothetical protein
MFARVRPNPAGGAPASLTLGSLIQPDSGATWNVGACGRWTTAPCASPPPLGSALALSTPMVNACSQARRYVVPMAEGQGSWEQQAPPVLPTTECVLTPKVRCSALLSALAPSELRTAELPPAVCFAAGQSGVASTRRAAVATNTCAARGATSALKPQTLMLWAQRLAHDQEARHAVAALLWVSGVRFAASPGPQLRSS